MSEKYVQTISSLKLVAIYRGAHDKSSTFGYFEKINYRQNFEEVVFLAQILSSCSIEVENHFCEISGKLNNSLNYYDKFIFSVNSKMPDLL